MFELYTAQIRSMAMCIDVPSLHVFGIQQMLERLCIHVSFGMGLRIVDLMCHRKSRVKMIHTYIRQIR